MMIQEVKKSLGRRVSYNGSDCYELTGCVLKRHKRTGQFYYIAELADLTCGKAVVYCPLRDVESSDSSERGRANDTQRIP